MMFEPHKQPVSGAAAGGTRTATECHECGVVCEWVIFPAHCLRSRCRYAYSYLDGDRRFFGCIERVFAVELDIDGVDVGKNGDAYGALKAKIAPLPECRARLEEAYRFKYSWKGCSNPTFRQHPDDYAPEAIRRLVDGRSKAR
ncbi:MAG: hypothetical protein Kow00129_11400 [Thermoleophilia bacterium]